MSTSGFPTDPTELRANRSLWDWSVTRLSARLSLGEGTRNDNAATIVDLPDRPSGAAPSGGGPTLVEMRRSEGPTLASGSVSHAELEAAALTALRQQSFYPGSWLKDTYRIERRLARGGMGEVFSATHARLPGLFAIKVLQPGFGADAEISARFRREAELMATLRHPHVVQVTDYDTSPEGRPYLVMEYLDGHDLGTVMERRGPLPPRLVVNLVGQIAAALDAAHARGVVHLDLKPENVVLLGLDDDAPFVKVIDFGIAKSAGMDVPGGETIIGTPEYMSPEQIEGRGARIDGRSDQFSLATLTFVMLTGHGPWGFDEPQALLLRIARERPQSLSNYLGLPMPHVQAVLARALAKAPEERYPAMTAFSAALAEAVARDVREGVLATSPGVFDEPAAQ